MPVASLETEPVVKLRNGGTVRIRTIRPDDKQRLLAHFSRLGPQSVYQRFFGMKKTLTDEELRRYTELDFVDAAALVATLGEGEEERIVGVGRYAVGAARAARRAEVAFAVEDAQQGRGIATELLARLIPLARRNGMVALEADVLGDNTAMLHVFARMGFQVRRAAQGIVHVGLPLQDAEAGGCAGRTPMYEFLERRVADAMTRDVVTVRPDTPLREVEDIFERHNFNGLPVMDTAGALLGFLTKLDLLKAFAFTPQTIVPHYDEILRLPAERVMTRDARTVGPETHLTRVLEELVRTRYKSFPVLENGRLVGIVSREDVLSSLRRAAS